MYLIYSTQSPNSTLEDKGTHVPNIQSPCNLICVIDQKSGHCFGCGRTGAEITEWINYSSKERSNIMDTLDERLAKIERKPRRETKRQRMAREGNKASE